MAAERNIAGQVARDIGRELVAEVGADIIRGRTNQGAIATSSWWNSWWRSFFAVWLSGMSSATLAAVKGRVVDALKRDPSIAADEVMDRSLEFDRFLGRLHEREPWRVQRFAELLAEIPDPSDQDKVFLGVFDAEPRDWEAQITSIAFEKSFSIKAGEWMREKLPDWAAVKRVLGHGWHLTKEEIQEADGYLDEHVAPVLEQKAATWCGQMDAFATRVEQRGGKITDKWWLPF